MARKIIPYPCDYKVTSSVKRARRAGNIFVVLLCVIVAALLGVGTYFAVADDYRALKTIEQVTDSYCLTRASDLPPTQSEPQIPGEPSGRIDPPTPPQPEAQAPGFPQGDVPPAQFEPEMPADPKTQEPTATPIPSQRPTVSVTPKASPDPDYEQRLAKPFAEDNVFAGLPDIVDAVYPGVVGILNQQFATGSMKLQTVGTGSGFVLTSDGYIVTNQHVVEGANAVQVSFGDGTLVDAALIGADVQTDVAVLKIETDMELTPLVLGDSDSLRVGEFVLAIGNPISSEELYGSVTFGIISAKARQINIDGFVNEYVQTDAAVNPGNSGGPLINMKGEVIGVTSAKYVTAGYDEYGNSISSEGIGFALPINNVMEIVDSMIKSGNIPRPGIGVTIATRSEEQALAQNKPAGVYVYSLTEGGPAEQAGLMLDDVIVALDGVEMTQDEFVNTIRGKKIGDQITFTVLRGGEKLEIVVTVGDLNQMH